MPVHLIRLRKPKTIAGKIYPPGTYWQWGHRGTLYKERAKALRQQTAAHARGFR